MLFDQRHDQIRSPGNYSSYGVCVFFRTPRALCKRDDVPVIDSDWRND